MRLQPLHHSYSAIISLLLCTIFSGAVFASCLQTAARSTPCPNQIYRAMQLPGMEKPALRCICVTDFLPLLEDAQTPEQSLAQLRLKQRLKTELQHDIEPVLQILRREH